VRGRKESTTIWGGLGGLKADVEGASCPNTLYEGQVRLVGKGESRQMGDHLEEKLRRVTAEGKERTLHGPGKSTDVWGFMTEQ